MNKYALYDENHDLIRVFMHHDEAVKNLTFGDYLVVIKTDKVPRKSGFEVAMNKVGECLL